jgi:hypothetical protein
MWPIGIQARGRSFRHTDPKWKQSVQRERSSSRQVPHLGNILKVHGEKLKRAIWFWGKIKKIWVLARKNNNNLVWAQNFGRLYLTIAWMNLNTMKSDAFGFLE